MKEVKDALMQLCSGAMEQLIATVMQHSGTFADVVAKTQNGVNALGVKILEQYYQLVDARYDIARDRSRVIVKNKTKTRTLITAMGNITLKRQLYLDKVDNRYFFAVDEILNLEKYSRIEQGYQAELLKNATLTSYGKASAICGNKVSRQTVFNISTKLKNYDIMKKANNRKTIQNVYIEADEDHIHLNDGKSGEVKLVYVHEGRAKLGANRTQLLNPKYFVSVDDDPDTIWNDVAMYISDSYSVKGDIHISGDGAIWIKAAQKVLKKSIYHLDKFHVCKAITESAYGSKKFRRLVFDAVRNKDGEKIKKLYSTAYHATDLRNRQKTLYNTFFYIKNNIDNIDFDNSRCSAESHVSHVLSARMSSRPMGWSKRGAERIAKLRAYMFNNGDFLDLIMKGKIEDSSHKLMYGEYSIRVNSREYDNCSDEVWARVVGLSGVTDSISKELRLASGNEDKYNPYDILPKGDPWYHE